LKFIIKSLSGTEVQNRWAEPQFRCESARCGTGFQMLRRCALRNRQNDTGAHQHC